MTVRKKDGRHLTEVETVVQPNCVVNVTFVRYVYMKHIFHHLVNCGVIIYLKKKKKSVLIKLCLPSRPSDKENERTKKSRLGQLN